MRRLTVILVFAAYIPAMRAAVRAEERDVVRLKQRLQSLEQETATAERRLAGLMLVKAASEAETKYWLAQWNAAADSMKAASEAETKNWSMHQQGTGPEPPPGRPVTAETTLQVGQGVLFVDPAQNDKDHRSETTVLEVLPLGYVRVIALGPEEWSGSGIRLPRGRIVPRESLELPCQSPSKPIAPVEAATKPALPASLQRLAASTAAPAKNDSEKAKVVKEMQEALTALLGSERPRAEELVAALRDDNRVVRIVAAMALAQVEPSAPGIVPVLLETPEEESWSVGEWEPSIPSVKRYWMELKDDSSDIRSDQWALASCGRYAVPRLLTAVRYSTDSSDYRNQWCAANVGFMRRDARAVVPMLIAGLHHEDPRVRKAAAVGLGGLKNRAAVLALQQAARDPSSDVQHEARNALAEILGNVEQKAPTPEEEMVPVP